MKVSQALRFACEQLRQKGCDEPRAEAERLLAHLLQWDRPRLLAYPEYELSEDLWRTFQQLVHRRAQGEPLAYLTGYQEFMSLEFYVNSHVLIPRPETEVVVEAVLSRVSPGYRLWDIGCGSGCIAISLVKYSQPSFVLASDISSQALEVATENARRHGFGQVIQFRQGDLWEAAQPGERFDVIVMNPPYIGWEERESLSREVLCEPEKALFPPGEWDLFYRELARKGAHFLLPEGMLVLELSGTRSLEEVMDCFFATPFRHFEVEEDWGGRERVLIARL